MEQVQMVPVNCNKMDHECKNIEYMCLNANCVEKSAVCSKCSVFEHLQCRNQFKEIEKIPQDLMEFKLLYGNFKNLKELIIKLFTDQFENIVKIITPIIKYEYESNLNNLNSIGKMLRERKQQSIVDVIDSSLKKIRKLLDNYVVKYELQREKIKQDQLYFNTQQINNKQKSCHTSRSPQSSCQFKFNQQQQQQPKNEKQIDFKKKQTQHFLTTLNASQHTNKSNLSQRSSSKSQFIQQKNINESQLTKRSQYASENKNLKQLIFYKDKQLNKQNSSQSISQIKQSQRPSPKSQQSRQTIILQSLLIKNNPEQQQEKLINLQKEIKQKFAENQILSQNLYPQQNLSQRNSIYQVQYIQEILNKSQFTQTSQVKQQKTNLKQRIKKNLESSQNISQVNPSQSDSQQSEQIILQKSQILFQQSQNEQKQKKGQIIRINNKKNTEIEQRFHDNELQTILTN